MDVWMKRAGSCGLYQVIHVTLTQFPRFVTAWAVFLMILAGYDPGWKCADNTTSLVVSMQLNKTIVQPQTILLPLANQSGHSTSLHNNNIDSYQNETEGYRYNRSKVNHSQMANSPNGNNSGSDKQETKTDSYNGACGRINNCSSIQFNPDSTTLVTEFQLVCDQSWVVKAILFLCGLGGLPGSFMAGYLGERYGRRLGLYTFTFLMSFFTGLAVFSPHWAMYAICSFFINFGANGTITQANVFTMEFLNSKWRGYFGAIPVWPFAFFMFTFTVRYLRNWIYLHLVTCFLSLSSCIGFFVLPESPRWLMVHQKPEEAKDAIRKVARINRKKDPTIGHECQENTLLETSHDPEKKHYSYFDLVRTRQLRTYSIQIFVVMVLFQMCYIGISFGLQSLPGDFYTNIIVSGCCDVVFPFLTSPLANNLGRRWAGIAVATLSILCCLCIILVLLLAGREDLPILIKACAFVVKSSSHGIFILGQVFVVELYPTTVRNLALGMAKAGTCLGGLLAPLLMPSSSDRSYVISFSFYCFCFLVDLGVFASLPETNKQNLEDVLSPPTTTPSSPVPVNISDGDDSKTKMIDHSLQASMDNQLQIDRVKT